MNARASLDYDNDLNTTVHSGSITASSVTTVSPCVMAAPTTAKMKCAAAVAG